jgi:RND family efflux transporter MFP subunit
LQAQLSAAKSKYNDARRNLNYTKIYSPIDGVIGTIDITVGNFVTPSSGKLTTIYSANPIYVAFTLSDKDYNLLNKIDHNSEKKRKVELYFNSGEKYDVSGYQDFSDNKIDPVTGSIKLRATFPNSEKRLLHGAFVKVKIYSNNKIAFPVVPVSAVLENQEGKYVYKLDSKGYPKVVYIETDGQYKNYWLIKKGIKSGDIVATSGLQKIIPNKRVKIINGN